MISKKRNYFFSVLAFSTALFFLNCASGDQKVVWQKAEQLDYDGNVAVIVEKGADVEVPESEWQFLDADIKSKVTAVFQGKAKNKAYTVKVTVTRYTEGNAFARFMLAGLGQMHLNATVEVKQSKPELQTRFGDLKKNYSWGGFVGVSANMRETINARVGQAIAEAIKEAVPAPSPS